MTYAIVDNIFFAIFYYIKLEISGLHVSEHSFVTRIFLFRKIIMLL